MLDPPVITASKDDFHDQGAPEIKLYLFSLSRYIENGENYPFLIETGGNKSIRSRVYLLTSILSTLDKNGNNFGMLLYFCMHR